MDSCCCSQDSFECNFPPLEFLIDDEQRHALDSQQRCDEQTFVERIEGELVLETPPSQKLAQKTTLEFSSPVTLSKGHVRPTNVPIFDDVGSPNQTFLCEKVANSKGDQKGSAGKLNEEKVSKWNPGRYPLSHEESFFENIIDSDDSSSVELIQEDNSICQNALATDDNVTSSNSVFVNMDSDNKNVLKQNKCMSFHCEENTSQVYDVLQHVVLPSESKEESIRRIGHEKLWELALNALLQGKHVVGDEIIYGKENWRKEQLTKLQIMELFGCQNSADRLVSHSTNARFLGAGGLYRKSFSKNVATNTTRTKKFAKNKFTYSQKNRFQKKKPKKSRCSSKQ